VAVEEVHARIIKLQLKMAATVEEAVVVADLRLEDRLPPKLKWKIPIRQARVGQRNVDQEVELINKIEIDRTNKTRIREKRLKTRTLGSTSITIWISPSTKK